MFAEQNIHIQDIRARFLLYGKAHFLPVRTRQRRDAVRARLVVEINVRAVCKAQGIFPRGFQVLSRIDRRSADGHDSRIPAVEDVDERFAHDHVGNCGRLGRLAVFEGEFFAVFAVDSVHEGDQITRHALFVLRGINRVSRNGANFSIPARKDHGVRGGEVFVFHRRRNGRCAVIEREVLRMFSLRAVHKCNSVLRDLLFV